MQKLLVQKALVYFNLLVTSTNMGHCTHPLVQVFYCVFERQQTTSRTGAGSQASLACLQV